MMEKSKLQLHFMISDCRYISDAFTPSSRVLPVDFSLSFPSQQLSPPPAGGIAQERSHPKSDQNI